jgi:hypothetical protein
MALGVPAPGTKGMLLMPSHAVRRFAAVTLVLTFAAGCGSVTAPDPVQKTEVFTGTLQPLGSDFKTFSIAYTQGTTDLSVSVDTLKTVANATSITGITIGIGFGTVSGTSCTLAIQTPTAALAQELFAPNGASAGTYCVQIFDCPTGTTGCSSMLPEPVTYSMTVRHY